MAVISLLKVDHAFDLKFHKNGRIEQILNPKIHNWLSQHKIRYQLIYDVFDVKIHIMDDDKAMLFKLTWR